MNKIDNHVNFAGLLHPHNHSANHPMKFMSQPDLFSPKNEVALHNNAAVGTKSLYQAISRQFSSSFAVTFQEKNEVEEVPEEKSFFDFEKVANNVLSFIGNRIEAAKSDGVDQEGIEELLQQARSGIEQGFGEALKELEELSLLDDRLAENIQKSRTLIDDGINELQQNLQPQTPNDEQLTTDIIDSIGQPLAIDKQKYPDFVFVQSAVSNTSLGLSNIVIPAKNRDKPRASIQIRARCLDASLGATK